MSKTRAKKVPVKSNGNVPSFSREDLLAGGDADNPFGQCQLKASANSPSHLIHFKHISVAKIKEFEHVQRVNASILETETDPDVLALAERESHLATTTLIHGHLVDELHEPMFDSPEQVNQLPVHTMTAITQGLTQGKLVLEDPDSGNA